MFALFLLLMPLIGLLIVSSCSYPDTSNPSIAKNAIYLFNVRIKKIALNSSICALLISLVMFALFDSSSNQFQFVQEIHELDYFNLYLGVDGLSIYFVLLTTIIMPVSLLSNWTSISDNKRSFLITILLLQTLLLLVFLVLDTFLFYIFFESILSPLFVLIGLFGSTNRVRASFYLFLYTLLGSLFLLLSILTMHSIMGATDFDALYKTNFNYYTQLVLFVGVFIAFAVKTPVMFLNSWLLKAHVESPLSGSIILAGIVLKLSLYGVLRLILPLLPQAYISCASLVYLIGVITIIYASVSTLRTIDVKELIAYSSVSHAAVYLMAVFSNTIQGIEGGIVLGLAHGFVSSGLFICAGGVLYDRSSTRLIIHYRGLTQIMPLFSIMFFILCLGNCGAPLTLNFIGEFMSLYGAFVKSPLLGALASSSIIFSAAYTIYMFNRISFAGSYSKFFTVNIPDLNKREFYILLTLVVFTVTQGIYPALILDGLHYSVTTLIYYSPIQSFFIFFSLTGKTRKVYNWIKNKRHVFLMCIVIALLLRYPGIIISSKFDSAPLVCVVLAITTCVLHLALYNLKAKIWASNSYPYTGLLLACLTTVTLYVIRINILDSNMDFSIIFETITLAAIVTALHDLPIVIDEMVSPPTHLMANNPPSSPGRKDTETLTGGMRTTQDPFQPQISRSLRDRIALEIGRTLGDIGLNNNQLDSIAEHLRRLNYEKYGGYFSFRNLFISQTLINELRTPTHTVNPNNPSDMGSPLSQAVASWPRSLASYAPAPLNNNVPYGRPSSSFSRQPGTNPANPPVTKSPFKKYQNLENNPNHRP